MNREIEALQERVNRLPDLSDLVTELKSNHVEYDVVGGTTIGFSLWHRETGAVQRAVMEKDTVFPEHTHQEHEHVVLIVGCVRLLGHGSICGPCHGKTLSPGAAVYFAPGEPHGFEVLENSQMIGITIPASGAYP